MANLQKYSRPQKTSQDGICGEATTIVNSSNPYFLEECKETDSATHEDKNVAICEP